MKMRTMQGVLCRRRAHAGLALSLVAYTLAFIALISLCRALFADTLSVVIADATSTWVSVADPYCRDRSGQRCLGAFPGLYQQRHPCCAAAAGPPFTGPAGA